MKKQIKMLIGIACMLGVLSLYLACQSNLFYENLTFVGNKQELRMLFMIWGISLSILYGYAFQLLLKLCHINKQFLLSFAWLCCGVSIVAFLLPYENHSGDILSQLHVYGSMISCIITYLLLLYVIHQLLLIYPQQSMRIQKVAYSILMVSVSSILLIGDISSFAELLLLNGLSFIFMYALVILEKNI